MVRIGAAQLWKPGMGAQIDRSHPLVRGLQACWLFNENNGGVAYDAMGRFPFVFSSTGVSRIATPTGPGVKFDGTNGQGIAAGNPLSGAAALTIILYVKQTAGPTNPFGPYFGTDLSSLSGVYVGSDSAGNTIFEIGSQNSSIVLPTGVWSHAAFRYNSVSQVKAGYLNGVQAFTTTNGFGAMPTLASTYIGKRPVGDGSFTTDSSVGYMKVWNRDLSQPEIAADYATPWAMFTPPNDRRFYSIPGISPGGGAVIVGSLAIGGSGRLSVGIG